LFLAGLISWRCAGGVQEMVVRAGRQSVKRCQALERWSIDRKKDVIQLQIRFEASAKFCA
jgi:hypothetical protein